MLLMLLTELLFKYVILQLSFVYKGGFQKICFCISASLVTVYMELFALV